MSSIRRFAITRLLLTIPMVFFLLTLIFVTMRIIPGDPISALLGEHIPEEYYQQYRVSFGFDKPIYVQYIDFLMDVLQFRLGGSSAGTRSFITNRPVVVEILERWPQTLELSLLSIVLAVVVGLATGIVSATHVGKKVDRIIGLGSLFGYSLPLFWTAMIMQLVLGVWLKILPVAGNSDAAIRFARVTGMPLLDAFLSGDIEAISSVARHYVLPVISMAYFSIVTIQRIARTEMVRTLHEDYIMTARAKGLRENMVVYKHAFRNALLPTLTIIGIQFAGLLGGTIVTETVFSLPGLGRLTMDSILWRDFPTIQGCVVFYALIVGICSFIVDLAYALIDPRVRF